MKQSSFNRFHDRYNRPKKKDNPEGRLTMSIIHYLKTLGAVVGKTKTMGVKREDRYCLDRYIFLGFPDLTFFYKDKLYFCEVKSPKGRLSEHQELFALCCKEANIPYIIARSLDDVIEILPK